MISRQGTTEFSCHLVLLDKEDCPELIRIIIPLICGFDCILNTCPKCCRRYSLFNWISNRTEDPFYEQEVFDFETRNCRAVLRPYLTKKTAEAILTFYTHCRKLNYVTVEDSSPVCCLRSQPFPWIILLLTYSVKHQL